MATVTLTRVANSSAIIFASSLNEFQVTHFENLSLDYSLQRNSVTVRIVNIPSPVQTEAFLVSGELVINGVGVYNQADLESVLSQLFPNTVGGGGGVIGMSTDTFVPYNNSGTFVDAPIKYNEQAPNVKQLKIGKEGIDRCITEFDVTITDFTGSNLKYGLVLNQNGEFVVADIANSVGLKIQFDNGFDKVGIFIDSGFLPEYTDNQSATADNYPIGGLYTCMLANPNTGKKVSVICQNKA
jgi:hypothetical protein